MSSLSAVAPAALSADDTKRVLELAAVLNGAWVLDGVRSDSIIPLLKEMGVPWLVQKMAASAKPSWEVLLSADGLVHTVSGVMANTKQTYPFAAPSTHVLGDGSKHPAQLAATSEGHVTLTVQHPKGDIITTYTHEGSSGESLLIAFIEVRRGGASVVRLKRVFRRK